MILAIRTDSFDAIIALTDTDGKIVARKEWNSGRQLSVQLPPEVDALLADQNISYDDLSGLIVYQGPGSFTGLRIGMTVANAIAHELQLPIVGSTGDNWIVDGVQQLKTAKPGAILTPVYGGEANITKPRK